MTRSQPRSIKESEPTLRLAPHKIHTSIKLHNYRHFKVDFSPRATAQRDNKKYCAKAKSVERKIARPKPDILIKSTIERCVTSVPETLYVSATLVRERLAKVGARQASTFRRFDDIFHVTSMMPIIFLTFSAEASFCWRKQKKTHKQQQQQRKAETANKMFKLNSLPVFLNLTTGILRPGRLKWGPKRERNDQHSFDVHNFAENSHLVQYRQPRFLAPLSISGLDSFFPLRFASSLLALDVSPCLLIVLCVCAFCFAKAPIRCVRSDIKEIASSGALKSENPSFPLKFMVIGELLRCCDVNETL